MKQISIAILCIGMAFTACNNGTDKSSEKVVVVDSVKVKVVDTVRTHVNEPAKTSEPVKTEPTKKDWHATMREYHDLLCKEHTGTATTDNKIREVELAKELNDVPATLSGDDKFYFTTEMARTKNMENCK